MVFLEQLLRTEGSSRFLFSLVACGRKKRTSSSQQRNMDELLFGGNSEKQLARAAKQGFSRIVRVLCGRVCSELQSTTSLTRTAPWN